MLFRFESFYEGGLVLGATDEQVFVNSGIYYFSKTDLNSFFNSKREFEVGSEITVHLLPFLTQNRKLHFFQWSGHRISIDSQSALEEARQSVSRGEFN